MINICDYDEWFFYIKLNEWFYEVWCLLVKWDRKKLGIEFIKILNEFFEKIRIEKVNIINLFYIWK